MDYLASVLCMALGRIHLPICSEVLRLTCRVGEIHCTPSLSRMGRSTEMVASLACCPSGSGKPKPVSRFRIPSNSHAGVYPQMPFASVAPALTAVSWLSDALLVRTTLPIRSSRTPFHSGIPSLGFLNSESGTQSA